MYIIKGLNNCSKKIMYGYRFLRMKVSNVSIEKNIDDQIKATHTAFSKLIKRVFGNTGLTQTSKLIVYWAVVISTLLYSCGTWVFYRKKNISKLERFHQRKFCQILQNRFQDRIAHNEVLLHANMESLETIMTNHQLQWAEHLAWMPDIHVPK